MNKEFVPYEPSLRLKALGFNQPCFAYYIELRNPQEGILTIDKYEIASICDQDGGVLAPTYSQAFKWFREKYQIFPEVLTDCTCEPKFVFTYKTFYGNPKDLTEQEWGWENNIGHSSLLYSTYEEAELACLIKLIEICEQKEK